MKAPKNFDFFQHQDLFLQREGLFLQKVLLEHTLS